MSLFVPLHKIVNTDSPSVRRLVLEFKNKMAYFRDYEIEERELDTIEKQYLELKLLFDELIRCVRGWRKCAAAETIGATLIMFEYEGDDRDIPELVVVKWPGPYKVYYIRPKL